VTRRWRARITHGQKLPRRDHYPPPPVAYEQGVYTASGTSSTDEDWINSAVSHIVFVHAVPATVHRRSESAVEIHFDTSAWQEIHYVSILLGAGDQTFWLLNNI
jgi:hypothetical protein